MLFQAQIQILVQDLFLATILLSSSGLVNNTHRPDFQVSLVCVLFHVSRTAGEADAEAEADAFYGLHGYGGFGVYQGYPGPGIYGGSGLTGWAGYGGHPYPYLAGYAPQPQAPYYPGYARHAPVISPVLSNAHAPSLSPAPAHFRAPDHGALHISALSAHPGVPHSVAAVPDLSPLSSAPAPSLALAPQHAPAYDVAPAHHVATAPQAAPAPHISHGHAPSPHVTTSQYHAQDEEGNYSFGYNNPNSAREERGNAHTGVRGWESH